MKTVEARLQNVVNRSAFSEFRANKCIMFSATFLIVALLSCVLEHAAAQLHDESFPDRPSDAELGKRLTREYRLKQGIVKGLVLEPRNGGDIGEVEVFLGLPYAAAPLGHLRFMPPVSAEHWNDIKIATSFAPVCPQTLPELKREKFSAGRYNYMKRLLPFLRNQSEDCLYLNVYVPSTGYSSDRNQQKYPVLVFIHGESYEWNSGNPYDGTVLAAYGKIIVITINFRLGILGFMKPSVSEDTIGNFGLLDQIAALHWVKENIAAFNGDPGSVTLVGHGTGAACVNFLMVSPVANGLFHRAILMSGTALSDWSLTPNPMIYTIQVAQALNCPITSEELAECLRKKKLSDIMAVRASAPEYITRFGPIVDHSVIPNEPAQVMGVYKDLFSRYDLMYGCTEMESYHLLGAIALAHGLLEHERNKLLKQYTQAKFEYRPEQALAEILREYAPIQRDLGRSAADTHRDTVLDILSDAQIAAPLVRTANFHSRANPNSYFYVFGHNSQAGEYAPLSKSVHGEELAYVFGVPLGASKNHFREEYSPQERLLSELLMTYWTNFVKTGNPNHPTKKGFLNLGRKDWNKYYIDWPAYREISEYYVYLGLPPSLKNRYRSRYMEFWNDHLPQRLNHTISPYDYDTQPTPIKPTPKIRPMGGPPEWIHPSVLKPQVHPMQRLPSFADNDKFGEFQTYPKPNKNFKPTREDPYKALKEMDKPNRAIVPGFADSIGRWGKPKENIPLEPITTTTEEPLEHDNESIDLIQKSALTMHLIIAAGVLFLLINVCAFALLYYKKAVLKSREREINRINNCSDFPDGDNHIYQKEIKDDTKQGCNMFKALKKPGSKRKSEDFYEPVKNHIYEGSKTPKSDDSGGFGTRFKLRRQMSSSTLDAHTKVRDWIAQEIVQRCSPNFLRKNEIKEQDPKMMNGGIINLPINKELIPKEVPRPNCKIGTLTGSLKAPTASTISVGVQEKQIKTSNEKEANDDIKKTNINSGRNSKPSNHSVSSKSIKSKGSNNRNASNGSLSKKEKPQKVSVAVDATPATRGSSVLKQEPIELSKSLDYCFYDDMRISGCNSPLRRSQTMEDIIKRSSCESLSTKDVFKSTVNLEVNVSDDNNKPPEIIKIVHKHSVSDPIKDINYTEMFPYKPGHNKPGSFSTFNAIQPPAAFRNDINVTSRDEVTVPTMTPAEALMTIKRRNFPKVLPDLPRPGDHMAALAQKRLSLPPQAHLTFIPNSVDNSPSNSELSSPTELKSFSRGPPLPPPRSSSTLGRNPLKVDPMRNYERMSSLERSRTLDRNPHHNYVEMHSNTLPNSTRLNSEGTPNLRNRPRVNMMDIERSDSFSQSEQSESEREDEPKKINYETVRTQPKLIISADPTEPIINERKLIIRPTINRNLTPKVTSIPRVVARDNSFESDDKIHSIKHHNVTNNGNKIKPDDVKIEIPAHKPDSKGPPTNDELERMCQLQEKNKDATKTKSNTLKDNNVAKAPDVKQATETKSTSKSNDKKTSKRNETTSKIPKTPIMGKAKKEQKTQSSPKLNKSQLKVAAKNSSIPQPVSSLKTTNDLLENEHSASESSNDTECSAETVKKIK